MQEPMDRDRTHYPRTPGSPEKPGKLVMFAFAGLLGAALLGVLTLGIGQRDTDVAAPGDQLAFSDQPTSGQIEECNQYAAQVARDGTFVGSPPAVTDQSLVGLSDENRYSDAAQRPTHRGGTWLTGQFPPFPSSIR